MGARVEHGGYHVPMNTAWTTWGFAALGAALAAVIAFLSVRLTTTPAELDRHRIAPIESELRAPRGAEDLGARTPGPGQPDTGTPREPVEGMLPLLPLEAEEGEGGDDGVGGMGPER